MSKLITKDQFVFLPLGGSNEIGMNVNLYHYNGKWIIIDFGAGFADDQYPGIDMIVPDISFILENRKDFLGIVLTHGHEDHLGSVGYLYDQLNLPIYATPFTAEIVKNKLKQSGITKPKLNIIQPGSEFRVGEFELKMIQITHSIPEMNGILLKTPLAKIFHTGDWKFDPNPVISPTSDFVALKQIGDEGIDALICDSTNIFNEKFSGSEGDLLPTITELVKKQKGTVYMSTFASNVARIETICKAAEACNRKVALAGLSLHKITDFAKATGYLKDVKPFISDKEIKNYPRDRVLVICTGCQGERKAAMYKIAHNQHPYLKLTAQDTVIFSSKIIPGNEKKIIEMMNRFIRLKCEVYTEKDFKVHVSGHPSREELYRMYELIRPKVAIPTHGEPVHLHEHTKFIKSFANKLGIEKIVEAENGEMILIANKKNGTENAGGIRHVKSGYQGVDGRMLQPKDGVVLKERRKIRDEGAAIVAIAHNGKGIYNEKCKVRLLALVDEDNEREFIRYLEGELYKIISKNQKKGNEQLEKKIKSSLQKTLRFELGKDPHIEVIFNQSL